MFIRFFVTLGVVAFWVAVPEIWEGSKIFLNDLYPNLTFIVLGVLLGIGAIAGVYEYKTSKKNHTENKELYKKLYEELKDGLDSLDGTLDRKTIQYKINGKEVNYKHIYMNHKVFDGLVNSGDFNHINHELQQPLQDIYGKIVIHDEFVKKIVDLEDNSTSMEGYVLTLNEYEKNLLNEFPSMLEKIKNILNKKTSRLR